MTLNYKAVTYNLWQFNFRLSSNLVISFCRKLSSRRRCETLGLSTPEAVGKPLMTAEFGRKKVPRNLPGGESSSPIVSFNDKFGIKFSNHVRIFLSSKLDAFIGRFLSFFSGTCQIFSKISKRFFLFLFSAVSALHAFQFLMLSRSARQFGNYYIFPIIW